MRKTTKILLATAAALSLAFGATACGSDEPATGPHTTPPVEPTEEPTEEPTPEPTEDPAPPQASDVLSDMSEYGVTNTDTFYDVSMLDVMNLLNDPDFDGVFYFGFPTCPWCQAAVPVLAEAAAASGARIYYVSRAHDLREGAWLDSDLAVAEWFDERVGLEWLTDEDGNETQPNIFVPFVAHVRGGEVVESHRGTFEGHDHVGEGDDRHLPEMTAEQRATLLGVYQQLLPVRSAGGPPECVVGEAEDSCD